MKNRPILVIDDDQDDLELINEAFRELRIPNPIHCFTKALHAIDFLTNRDQHPLFILCDINMNEMNGLELRQMIYEDKKLKMKAIPFLFLSTGGTVKSVSKAYDLSVQGYFLKPNSFDGIVTMLRNIFNYWTCCNHPNTEGLKDD